MFSLSDPRRWKAARSSKWSYDIHSNNNVIYVYSIRDAMLEEWIMERMQHLVHGASPTKSKAAPHRLGN
jgi:hypothetical protein